MKVEYKFPIPWLVCQMILLCLFLTAGCGQQSSKTGLPAKQIEKPATPTRLSVGSVNATSSTYAYFAALADVLNKKVAQMQVTIVETGAGVENIKRMAQKQLDIGLITGDSAFRAYRGTEGVQPVPDLRGLWVFSLNAQYAVVREDSGIKTFEELQGKPFAPGYRGSATEATMGSILNTLGIQVNEYRGSTSDLTDAIKDKRIIGYVKGGNGLDLDASTIDIATLTPVRILSYTPDQANKIKEKCPYITFGKMPPINVKNVKGGEDVTTWVMTIGIGALKDLPEEVAYAVTKAAIENKEEQANAFSGCAKTDFVNDTLKYMTIPLHSGAIRYFKEKGVNIPSELIPPEAK